MEKELFLHSLTPVLPAHSLPQNELVNWIVKAHKRAFSFESHEEAPERLWKRFCLGDSYISKRYFECYDVDDNWEDHSIYRITKETPQGATMGERNLYFREKVSDVFAKFYENKIPRHVIHVSCTGYVAPSPAQIFFQKKETSPTITHAYHMGCYASLPSTRMAAGMANLYKEEVDVVHTEMCSLHFNPTVHTPEQFVVQTLFADGYIKYSVSEEKKGFRILGIHEKLVPDSLEDMTWIPNTHGMSMTLSRNVPGKISEVLPQFMKELCQKTGTDLRSLYREAVFAVHPGGPKIIEGVQKQLELTPSQVELSHKVLYERGNMSSATLPHVWNEILKEKKHTGKKVVSLAFGPGLTIFGSVFEVVE